NNVRQNSTTENKENTNSLVERQKHRQQARENTQKEDNLTIDNIDREQRNNENLPAELLNISMAVENQTPCIIDKNKSCEVKTSNIKEKKTKATQKIALIAQSAQVLKEDMSGIKKNKEKP
ncbi:23457_t:CDS:2, partial [Gigaspora margarita]